MSRDSSQQPSLKAKGCLLVGHCVAVGVKQQLRDTPKPGVEGPLFKASPPPPPREGVWTIYWAAGRTWLFQFPGDLRDVAVF